MKLKTLLIIALLTTTTAKAQFEFPAISARGNAMGGCITTLEDYWSSVVNIAGLANFHKIEVGIAFHQNYIINNQSYKSLAISIPTKQIGTAIASYTHYGNATYNEQQLIMGYAMHISPYVALGVTFNYLHSHIADTYYEPLNAISFSTGIQIYPNDKLIIGGSVFNPIQFTLKHYNSTYTPFIFDLGLSYKLFNNFMCAIEFWKRNNFPFTIKVGLEYTIFKFLYARIGFSTSTQIIGFGLGWNNKNYCIDITAQVHPNLGLSPQISMTYLF